MGALPGNRNRGFAHGLRCFHKGRWPVGCSYIPRNIKRIGDGLRAELVRKYGKSMSVSEQVELLDRIGAAVNSRDKKLEELGLSIKPDDDGDIWTPARRLGNGEAELIDNEDDE
jgi:hypothetical protein